jgi:coenzyme PQQ synthesis protein D (PqqD)
MTDIEELRRWKAPVLVWARFEDLSEWVVFNPESTELHLINEVAHRLWALASEGRAQTIEDLAAALAAEHAPVSSEALRFTRDMLVFMDDTGLLQPA